MTQPKPATVLAQLGHYLDPASGGLAPPIQPSTTFARDEGYALINPAHTYGRDDNPGYLQVEAVLCALEAGAEALVFPSGMAAIAALFRTLRRGEAVAVQRPIYYGTLAWLAKLCTRREIALHHFEGADPARLEQVVQAAKPAIVWIETPSNPMLDVVDIAVPPGWLMPPGALLAVDSTAATPILTRPLALGADLVMHSATKYLNGHSDLVAGVLVTKQKDERWAAICADRHDAGALLGPFEAWLLCAGCARSRCAYARRPTTRSRSRACSRPTPRSSECSIPACRATPGTPWRYGRWRAAAAASCRSRCEAMRPPRSR